MHAPLSVRSAGTLRKIKHLTSGQVLEEGSFAWDFIRAGHQGFISALAPSPLVTVSFEGMGEPSEMEETIVDAMSAIRTHLGEEVLLQFIVSTIASTPSALDYWADQKLGLQSLQISLHGSDDDGRHDILLQKGSISTILEHLDRFAEASPETQIKINYVLIAGVNDSDADAERLCQLLEGRDRVYLNISRLNETEVSLTEGLSRPTEERFAEFLADCVERRPAKTVYAYGSIDELGLSCGQSATYAESRPTAAAEEAVLAGIRFHHERQRDPVSRCRGKRGTLEGRRTRA